MDDFMFEDDVPVLIITKVNPGNGKTETDKQLGIGFQ